MRDPDVDDMLPELGQKLEAGGGDEARSETPGLDNFGYVHVEGGGWGGVEKGETEELQGEDLHASDNRLSVSGFVTGRGSAQKDTMAQKRPRCSSRQPLGVPVVPKGPEISCDDQRKKATTYPKCK